MSTPSLLCVPYRLKAGTLYSQIPDSGLGDFVVTRSASNSATRVNAAGLIETVADNVPRLDYPLGGITAGCPALLVEPSAQNLALRSAELDNAVWTNALWGNWSNATAASSTTLAPDGSTNAEELTFTIGTSSRLQRITGISASTTYTFSMYVMGKAGNSYQNGIFLRIATGFNNAFVATAATVRVDSTVSNTAWTRYSVTFTTPSSGVNEFNVGITVANSGTNPNATMICWGAQLEVGSIATSYIPTSASPVTRGAETISKTGVSSLIGQTEGTIYAEVDVRNLGISRSFMNVQDASYATNAVRIESQGNNWRIQIRAASATILDQTIASPAFTTGIYKVAFAYSAAANGVSFAVNGTIIYTNASALTMPSGMDRVHLGTRSTASPAFDLFLNDRIRAAALYPTRLPNTGPLSLQSLTQ